jgi:hypothetical protein
VTRLVDTVAPGRETHAWGKASHRGHGGHGGRWAVVAGCSLGDIGGMWARNTRWRKASHRGHGGHRGEMGCGGRVFFGRHRRHLGEKHALGGKHRTEVTKVTEGGWAVVAGFFGRHRRHLGEKHALEESIAQRSRRSQRGDGRSAHASPYADTPYADLPTRFSPPGALWWTPWLSCTKNSYSCQTATGAD